MDLKVLKYVGDYAKTKYPMYYNKKDSHWMRMINYIGNKYTVDEIVSGKVDYVIDELIIECIENDLGFSGYNSVRFYIKDIILERYKFWNNDLNGDILDEVVKKVFFDLTSMSPTGLDHHKYMNGIYDKLIFSFFEKHIDEIFDNFSEYVYGVLENCNTLKKCCVEMHKYLADSVVESMFKRKKITDVLDGKYDGEIIVKYDIYYNKTKSNVEKYVRKVVYKMEFIFGVSEDDVVNFITKHVLEIGDMDLGALLNGKLDNYIVEYASRKRKNMNSSAMKKYIYDKIYKLDFDAVFSDEELSIMQNDIYIILKNKYGFSVNDVLEGRCDDIISRIFDRKLMCYSSVKDSKTKRVPDKVKYQKKKKKIPKSVITLLLIAALAGGSLYGINKIVDKVEYNIAYSEVEDFTDYSHSYIFSPDNVRVEPTAINALDFYNKVKSIGIDEDVYCYLGFYNAYVNVRQDKLYIMDELLDHAIANAREDSKYQSVYKEIYHYNSYLEFVMDRLYDMGCEEIKESKYDDALEAYLVAKCNPDVEIPMNAISNENARIIREIMEMYREYSKEAVLKFSKVIPVVEDSGLVNLYENSGRKK